MQLIRSVFINHKLMNHTSVEIVIACSTEMMFPYLILYKHFNIQFP